MRRLIISGVAPADAALRAKAHSGSVSVENVIQDFEVREDVVDSLHRASKSLDKNFVETLLRKDISENGVIASWTEVIVPLLFLVGDEWAADWHRNRSGAHAFRDHQENCFVKVLMEIKDPVNAQPVLLASLSVKSSIVWPYMR